VRKAWLGRPVLWASFLLLVLFLASCGSMQSAPQQEATLDAMRACDHFPGVWIDRVEADGRYFVKQNNEGNWRLFQECVAKYRVDASRAQYAKAEPKDLVYRAHFIKASPPTGMLLQTPPAVTEFKPDEPVTFFLNVYRSGRDYMAKWKWYKPGGILVLQQDSVIREGTGKTARTWVTQVLPSAHVRDSGEWTLEVYLDNQVVRRYPFLVSP